MKKTLSSSFRTTFSVLLVGMVSILCSYFLSQVDASKHNPHHSVIESVTPSVVLVLQNNVVTGAWVIVDSHKGLILTSKHLILPASQIMTQDKQVYSIAHIYSDKERDLALVQVTSNASFSSLPNARFVSTMNSLEKGDSVIAFGALSLSQSVALSQWIISDVSQKVPTNTTKTEFAYFIQTDVGAVDGFSGGPLVNQEWLVIGVNSAVFGLNNRISWSTPVIQDTLDELLHQK